MNQVRKELMAVSKSLKQLTGKTEKMLNALDKLDKAPAAVKQKAKAKPAKKVAVKTKAKAKAKAKATAGEVILNLITKGKKGVDTANIQKTTGFDNQKVRDNIYKLQKRGKIKRVDRGIYIAV